jgi:hypothetical protein
MIAACCHLVAVLWTLRCVHRLPRVCLLALVVLACSVMSGAEQQGPWSMAWHSRCGCLD